MYRATGRLIGLVLVTLCALAVMITFGAGRWFGGRSADLGEEVAPRVAAASVIVKTVHRQPLEILDRYSGTIEPLEKFALGFQIAGRLEWLGEGELGRPLDEGDEIICRPAPSVVASKQAADADRRAQLLKDLAPVLAPEGFLISPLLARLDSELLKTQRDEMMVQLEQAHYDMEIASKLWRRKAITDTEYQSRRTDFLVARVRYRIADRRLRDTRLRLVVPTRGARNRHANSPPQNEPPRRFIISKRLAIPGETLSAHQTVFELVEVDQVKLVIGVPESRVREIDLRMREVEANRRRARAGAIVAPENLQILVHVRLLGKRRFGEAWPALQGYVHQVSETAGDSGLFDLEIIIDNPDGTLKPGLFAMADIVLERIDGFLLPRSAIRYDEDGSAYLFSVNTDASGSENGEKEQDAEPTKATRYDLVKGSWLVQGSHVIVRDLPVQHQTLVVRGQHRLTPGRPVKIVEGDTATGDPAAAADVEEFIRVPIVGSKP